MTSARRQVPSGQGALEAYGYTQSLYKGKTLFRKATAPNSQYWAAVKDGFERYELPTATAVFLMPDDTEGELKPWGRPALDKDGNDLGLLQVPWQLKEEFRDRISGAHPANESDAMFFEWVWPDSVVAEMYHYGMPGTAYRATYDEEGNKTGYEVDKE
jgi:hypothetical protein